MEKLKTPKGKSYWGETGAYQKEYSELWDKLVPASGEAPTLHGELVRAVGRLFYEYCNNGNCNAVDSVTEDCDECDGSGYEEVYQGTDDEGEEIYEMEDCSVCGGECTVETGKTITDMYDGFLDLIEDHVKDAPVGALRALMTGERGYGTWKFDDDEMGVYNAVVDEVMYFVLTTENKPR